TRSRAIVVIPQLLVVVGQQNIAGACTYENEDVIDMHVSMSHISKNSLGFGRRRVDAQLSDIEVRFDRQQLLAFVREDQLLQYNPVDYKCHAFAHFFREEMLQLRFAFEVLKKDIRIQKCADLLRGYDLLMVPNAEF